MAGWSDLDAELDRWRDLGLAATLWWRDDDAAALAPQVERLVSLAAAADVPLHLAVIPLDLTEALTAHLQTVEQVRVLQHGYAHIDHAPKGEGSWELGAHRPQSEVLAELAAGMARLKRAFAARFLPVLVPPWTRIDAGLVPRLPGAGFRALSMEGARHTRFAAAGLKTLNAHCDPIKWKGGARFTGTERALDEIVRHLAARRAAVAGTTVAGTAVTGTAGAEADEPTGLCTHHLAHDEAVWGFVEAFIERTCVHPGARWIGLEAELEAEEAPC